MDDVSRVEKLHGAEGIVQDSNHMLLIQDGTIVHWIEYFLHVRLDKLHYKEDAIEIYIIWIAKTRSWNWTFI